MKAIFTLPRFFIPFLLLLLLFKNNTYGSHLVGVDITYKASATPNVYDITLVVYRTCSGNQLCNNCPTNLSPSCSQSIYVRGAESPYLNSTFSTVNLNINTSLGAKDIIPLCKESKTICSNCGTRTPGTYAPGIERYVFTGTIDLSSLPLNCCKVRIDYNNCCRDLQITNLANPGVASMYTYVIINRCFSSDNNSPDYWQAPVFVANSGQDAIMNCGAFDIDGDSLSYHIAPALNNLYDTLPYASPYNYQHPCNYLGFPTLSPPGVFPIGFGMDPETGVLKFRPIGSYLAVLAYDIREWRKINGVYTQIGEYHRDFQFTSNNTTPNLPVQIKSYTAAGASLGNQLKFTVFVQQAFCIQLSVQKNTTADTTDLSWFIPEPLWSDGARITRNYDSSTRSVNGPRLDSIKFCWTPSANKVRSLPYAFTLDARDRVCPLPARYTTPIMIRVSSGPIVLDNIPASNITYNQARTGGYILNRNSNQIQIKGIVISSSPQPLRGKAGVMEYVLNNNSDSIALICSGLNSNTTYFYRFFAGNDSYIAYADQDSFRTQSFPSALNLPDTLIAFNTDSFLLDGGSGLSNPIWDGKDSAAAVWRKQDGRYKLCVLGAGGSIICDSIVLVFIHGIQQKDSSMCMGATRALSLQAPAMVKHHWGNGDTAAQVVVQPNQSTYYHAYYSLGSFSLHDSVFTKVNPLPDNTLSYSKNKLCLQQADSILLSAKPNYVQYRWKKDGLDYLSGTAHQLYIRNTGSYQLILTDSNGCTNSSSPIAIAAAQSIKAQIGISPAAMQCLIGNSFNLSDISAGPHQRKWELDGNTSTSQNITSKSFGSAGLYPLKLVVQNTDGCIDSTLQQLQVFAQPEVGTISGNDTLVFINQPYLHSVPFLLNAHYLWQSSMAEFVNPQGNSTMTLKWKQQGIGSLRVILTDSNGCKDTSDYFQVNVLALGLQNNPGISDFSLWPNPNNGFFFISLLLNQSQEYHFEVLNVQGETVWQDFRKIDAGRYDLHLNLQEPSGLYFLKIISQDGTYMHKFVIQKP